MLSIQRIINKPVTSNCFVLYDKAKGSGCIIVDPGSRDANNLLSLLLQEGLIPEFIILTHEHFDHCWCVNPVVDRFHIPIICSPECAEAIKHEKRNCSVFYDSSEGFTIDSETISVDSIGDAVQFNSHKIAFYRTPGHTDASISFVVGRYLFTGDTLIKGEKTVTKLPTGSADKLKESMCLYAKMQGAGYKVYPGHGEPFELDGYDLAAVI